MIRLFLCVIFVASILFMAGCERPSTTTSDVTNDTKFHGGFPPKSEFALQQDVFWLFDVDGQLLRPNQDTGRVMSNNQNIVAPTIENFLKDKKAFPYIKGVVSKGARLRISRLELYQTISFRKLYIYAEVLDGDYKGQIVEIQDLADSPGSGIALHPRTDFLLKIQ